MNPPELTESWVQIISLFLANAGLIVWFRAESRSDWRHMDAKLDAIQTEMKDFHGRLCAIEERKHHENSNRRRKCK